MAENERRSRKRFKCLEVMEKREQGQKAGQKGKAMGSD